MIKLAIGIHNHQPVGNFDGVFKEALERAYLPFLETLSRHRLIKASIHNSGILYEWFERNGARYTDILAELTASGQVELLTGGFYEPILPAVPERDAIGQIRMLSLYLEERFGTTAAGCWTAERVWEPHLPRLLKKAGITYTILDDYHFRAAGLSEKMIRGYFLTEDEGETVAVFPISKDLRYLIPFKPVDEVIAYLRSFNETSGDSVIVFADDGEKFGIWPGTYKWVVEEGWLESLFMELERNSGWIKTVTFKEALELFPPSGIVYLPAASYHEMMEWALFDEARVAFHQVEEELKAKDLFDKLADYAFLRGGLWRNFLAKYPEANNLHKKMMRVSRKIESASNKIKDEGQRSKLRQAQRKLWAGQCNCPYWHGVFGGLYLPHLRSANYGSLIEAENIADALMKTSGKCRMDFDDFDGDGREEVILETRDLNIFVSPSLGAGVVELDYRPLCMNLMDVMRRKLEPYHDLATESGDGSCGESDGVLSIHDLPREKAVSSSDVVIDPQRRLSFIDRFLPERLTLDEFSTNKFNDLGDFAYKPYSVTTRTDGDRLFLSCERESYIKVSDQRFPFFLRKMFELKNGTGRLRVHITLEELSRLTHAVNYGMEFSIGEIAGNAEDRYMIFRHGGSRKKLGSPGEVPGLQEFQITDEWKGLTIKLAFSLPVTLWHFPIETLSQSEGGFEFIYQGTTFLAMMPVGPQQPEIRSMELLLQFRGGEAPV
ncbi:MAG: alpha-amylase/4-alpha-glucanotransferase domain-containing protein [Candidatus Glassbacteria bacterium]